MTLAQSVLSGDRLSLARLLTHIENDTFEGQQALDALVADGHPVTLRTISGFDVVLVTS